MPATVPRAKYRARQLGAMRNVYEVELQAAVFDWIRSVDFRNAEIFHVPNGRQLDRLEAATVSRLGVRRGVADLAVMLDDGRQGWIELKAEIRALEPEQRAFGAICARLGHRFAVARSVEDVRRLLVEWGATWTKRAAAG